MSKNKGCELCCNAARIFCDSDQASLCWGCDEKVHAANFLVAKHSRNLLCHVCQSPTPWNAAGPRLGPTVSVCHACAARENGEDCESQPQESESDGGEYYSDGDDDDYEEDEDEEEEDGENQVVPWSDSNSAAPPVAPPAAVCSSSSGEHASFSSSLKRMSPGSPNFDYEDEEDGCCSSGNPDENCDSRAAVRLLRPLKTRRTSTLVQPETAADGGGEAALRSCSGTAAIVKKLRRFQREEGGETSAMILGICNLSRDSERV